MRTSPRGGSRKSWEVAKIVRLGDTSAPRRRNLTFVITSARECPHVALEVVDRYRGNDAHRRGRRLAVEALGYRRNRRAGGGNRCRGYLLGTRPRPTHRRLHGDRGAIDDEPRTLHARRSRIGVPAFGTWRRVHRGRGHRVRDLGHRGRASRRQGARLPTRRICNLGLGSYRARGRNMARGVRGGARSRPKYPQHFGLPRSRVPTAGTVGARPSSKLLTTLVSGLIHRSAWKGCSANFALTGLSEIRTGLGSLAS